MAKCQLTVPTRNIKLYQETLAGFGNMPILINGDWHCNPPGDAGCDPVTIAWGFSYRYMDGWAPFDGGCEEFGSATCNSNPHYNITFSPNFGNLAESGIPDGTYRLITIAYNGTCATGTVLGSSTDFFQYSDNGTSTPWYHGV